jgi:Mycoplasma protein of unknown function, DUF285
MVPTMTPVTVPTAADAPPPPASQFLCFADDNLELYNAVDLYLDDPSPNSALASIYGWPIGEWCVSNVTDFHYLFSDLRNSLAVNFNQDLNSWDVSSGIDFYAMFEGSAIDQNFSNWADKVTQGQDMAFMFSRTRNFQGHGLRTWNVTTSYMFQNASVFNEDISSWNLNNTLSTKSMFQNAVLFNQDLGSWTLGNVKDIRDMFQGAASFSSNLCSWDLDSLLHDTAAVTNMFNGSNCPDQRNPNIHAITPGPFCFECY